MSSSLKTGSLSFECQHGEKECEANIIHCCVIESIHDTELRLNMVSCMIRDNYNPQEAFHRVMKYWWKLEFLVSSHKILKFSSSSLQCSKEFPVDVETIQKCYTSLHGRELLKIAGDATKALRPKVSFIPTITIDGDQRRQASVLKDLLSEVCEVIKNGGLTPKACDDI